MKSTFRRGRVAIACLSLVSVSVLTACGSSDDDKKTDEVEKLGKMEGKVSILAWPGYVEDGSNDPKVDWVSAFEKKTGGKPLILVAKMGQDGHDRGQKVIATAFADLGFDVTVGAMFQTPEEIARLAAENDVHVVGASSLAAGHLTLIPELKAALKKQGREDILIVAGGVIPPQDFDAVRAAGAVEIFPPGTAIPEAAERLVERLLASS